MNQARAKFIKTRTNFTKYYKNKGTKLPIRKPELGLKRKCIFQFLRKCENHAKIGRFLRNFTKFRFAKISYNFREIFAKMS
jgi:hypothetical protein